jgi:TetR/AcrR family transcriptional regulator, cholesterol catabolism regulator
VGYILWTEGIVIGSVIDKFDLAVAEPEIRHTSKRSSADNVTRLRIQQVALDLFCEKGYQSTSTRDVAAALGVQQGSLYYHIKNKEELLREICHSSFLQVIENAEAVVAASHDPLGRVRQISSSHLTTMLKYQKEFSICIMECRSLSAEYRAESEKLWQRYRTLIFSVFDGAKQAGVVRNDISNRYLFGSLMDMLNWPLMWFKPGKGLSIAEMDAIFGTIFLYGAADPVAGRTCGVTISRTSAQTLASLVAALPPVSGGETHARLLDVACSLFKTKGYYATSVREIADLMGMQKASLYYYMSGKEDLIYQISRASLEYIAIGVTAVLAEVSTPIDRIHALIMAHVVCLLRHPNWYAAAHDELHALSPARREQIVGLRDDYEFLLRQTLEEGQAAGVVRADVPAKFLGLVLLGMINCIYPWYQPEIDLTPVELGCLLADLFLHGVACGMDTMA